jgi:trimethylamine--corrinoid protein Co-methyltransferase
MDPRTGGYIVSIPEKYLCNAAGVQLAHDWGVPALAGAFSMDSPQPDTWQLGRDSVYTAFMTALAGAEMAEGLGMLRASTLLLPEQIIYDDEIYHTHRHLAQGIDTSGEGLALDVITAAGPRAHFLSQKHTRQHVRDIWMPELSHPAPLPSGEHLPDIRERARAKLDQILRDHHPPPLAEVAQRELVEIINNAEDDL